ncbi:MAG: M67 family metallopeptidase [Lachnospiraceae bacterium]|nr:M67 family metallopeptidase [Lachnospiraceae bacterium]
MDVIVFAGTTLDEIKNHANDEYPLECCGILIGKTEGKNLIVCHIKKTSNSANKSSMGNEFRINPYEVYQLERDLEKKGSEVLGFYHSHPDYDALLSDRDERYMIPGMVYPVVAIKKMDPLDRSISVRVYMKNAEGWVEEKEFVCR